MRGWGAAIIAAMLALAAPASAHDGYSNWRNRADKGCCNDHDCAPISDEHVRVVAGAFEVELTVADRTEWCPVHPTHYLRTGNAPDWSTAHVCVEKTHVNGARVVREGYPCSHLLCFQPKPQF